MDIKTGQYFYAIRGTNYRIYRKESNTDASLVIGEPVCFTQQEARKRVYELNGWKQK